MAEKKIYELNGKASVGFGLRRIIKGETITANEFNLLPKRIKPFFQVVTAKQDKDKNEPKTVNVADPENPEQIMKVEDSAPMPDDSKELKTAKEAIQKDKQDNFRTQRKQGTERK